MKTQLSIQEKLWDLRKERKLNLEEVATAVDISPATLSNYENKDYKDISLSLLTKLAKYYQVSLDWLAGLSETKEPQNIAISELGLDDDTLELLKSHPFNNRLLCEIIKHPDFIKLMLDTEIYVDGLATMQIKNMNSFVEAVRTELVQQHHPNSNDLHLNSLEQSYIKEDEYFFHTIHKDWDAILRTIRENHQYDLESSPIDYSPYKSEKVNLWFQIIKSNYDAEEAFWRIVCLELGIKYDSLSEKEHSTMKKILKKSKVIKTFPNHKNKGHNKKHCPF